MPEIPDPEHAQALVKDNGENQKPSEGFSLMRQVESAELVRLAENNRWRIKKFLVVSGMAGPPILTEVVHCVTDYKVNPWFVAFLISSTPLALLAFHAFLEKLRHPSRKQLFADSSQTALHSAKPEEDE